MNYTIEPDGTIVLKKSPREAELLYRAVQSKSLQLRKDPASKETADQYLGISALLNEAIVDSHQAKMKLAKENLKKNMEARANGITQVQKTGFFHRLINFFDNPFHTHEYEYAHTRCGVKFTIDGMVFSKELYPSEVYGTVDTEEGEVQVTWNDRGRCYCNTLKDVQCYDLIRQDQKERNSNMIMGFAFIGLLFLLIYLSLLY
ncbi:MAG: hypothetical protein WCK18_20345 [Prolixibacteraceae bacterium]